MKYLAIDHGASNLGFAVGDDESKIALPFDTHKESNLERQLAMVQQIVLDEEIDMVVVGYPIGLSGEETAQTARTLDFIEELAGRLSIPVEREDERLSSKMARVLMQEAPGGGYDEHALAATSILQSYLDRLAIDKLED